MRYAILILMSLPLVIYAQDYSNYEFQYNDDGQMEFSRVVESPGKDKPAVYASARQWFVTSFNSSTHVLEVDNADVGLLSGKGTFKGTYSIIVFDVNFNIRVMVKDNKSKIIIDNVMLEYKFNDIPSSVKLEEYLDAPGAKKKDGTLKKPAAKFKHETVSEFIGLLDSFESSLSKSKDDFDF